jgi:glutamyl-tRNA reductase
MDKLIDEDSKMKIDDIKKLINEKRIDEADSTLNKIEKKYEEFKRNYSKLEDINNMIESLTNRVANGELTSNAFEKARDDLDRKKKEIEEELWKLRNKLFKDDYEKPF